ncbi:hypothetical protein MLD38_017463 [Melastoma candidum]|uniref:Uncharacterized protein n=1 Tax=Melastoma candidum TaxID=119954 RepID=A0ACB9QSL7_9MYRT|nr:hypothetical protein MLD38_017463 [Melastoma candidum]
MISWLCNLIRPKICHPQQLEESESTDADGPSSTHANDNTERVAMNNGRDRRILSHWLHLLFLVPPDSPSSWRS